MVNKIRKTGLDNVIPIGKGGSSSTSGATEKSSPFAANPTEGLRRILKDKKGSVSEEEMLRRLQDAFEPFAEDAREHLPQSLRQIEQNVRKQMVLVGYSGAIAKEAGDEVVTVMLEQSPNKKS